MPIGGGGQGSSSGGPGADGWTVITDTCTFVSATSFKIVGKDVTGTYPVGTRIKCTQTTAKYFVVVSAAFSTDTTVTVTGGSDYSLANAAIVSPYYSYQASPQGYPGWFNYSPTLAGYSANPTIGTARFYVVGNACTVQYQDSTTGTSNATTLTISAPITAAAVAQQSALCIVDDNSATLNSPGNAVAANGSGTITIGKTPSAAGGFTASGGKAVLGLTLTYRI